MIFKINGARYCGHGDKAYRLTLHGGARAGADLPKGAKTLIYRPRVEKLIAAGDGMLPKDVMLTVMSPAFPGGAL
jgi:hypothetical protein